MSDYHTTYEYFFNKTERQAEKFLKDCLAIGIKENRPHNFTFSEALKKLHERYNKIKEFLKKDYLNTLSIFNSRASYYAKDTVKSILENEVKPEFEKEYKSSSNKNYMYLKCIGDLAQLTSLKNVEARFSNNTDLYELLYHFNDLAHFTLSNYKEYPELKKLYYELKEKRYGKKELPDIPVESKRNSLASVKANKSKMDKINDLEYKLSNLDEGDKILLLHICYECMMNRQKAISLVEFAKIITITKDIYDYDLFRKGAAEVKLYNKLYKGISYYNSKKTQIDRLERLIDKVTILEMKEIKNILINKKVELQKKHNQ